MNPLMRVSFTIIFLGLPLNIMADSEGISVRDELLGMACESSEGFSTRMADAGFWRDSTWFTRVDGYKAEDVTLHTGNGTRNITLWRRGRLALYVSNTNAWKLVQSVKRQDKLTGNTERLICTLQQGKSFVKH